MQSLGDRLYAFELGNEPDLYVRQIGTFTYSSFQSDWETYRNAILTAVDAAKTAGTLPQSAKPRFTGPAISYPGELYQLVRRGRVPEHLPSHTALLPRRWSQCFLDDVIAAGSRPGFTV